MLFSYQVEVRKIIDTINDAAKKVIYLAIQNLGGKWAISIRNCKPALNCFISLKEVLG